MGDRVLIRAAAPIRGVASTALLALAALGCAAAVQGPPRDPDATAEIDLVEVTAIEPTIRVELGYATTENFLGEPVYPEGALALLQRPAAEALGRVQAALAPRGLGLVVYDAYRPWSVTKLFWDRTPPEKRAFVANPRRGSRHNRGCAVDVGLLDLATGRKLPMPSAWDDFSERAHPDWEGGRPVERANRDLLRAAMEAEGFTVYENEWWHFDHEDWRDYPILDLDVADPTRPARTPSD